MKDWLKSDSASALAKRATDILFIQSPVATSMGVMCGFFFNLVVNAFKPLWEHSKVVDFSAIPIYGYVFSGIFVCNIVSLLFSLFRRRSLSKQIEDQLTLIRLAKKEGNLPEYQIKLMYTNLAEKVLRDVDIKNRSRNSSKNKSPARRRKPSSD